MAFVDDPNSNSQDNQVAGATPLGNTAPAQQGSDTSSQGSQGDSQPSTIQSDGQPATTNKKAKKASSGMYTNIQKYVEKNKPQAQNMANAVSQDVGKQAEQIRQSVEAQKDQQSKVLQSNQQAIQSGSDWAKQQVGNIMAPTEQAQPYSPSEADITKFQGLMQGNVQGLQKVGDLNIADQSAKARALQSLAQSTNTEQGRRNLLGQTFQKQGEYGRGMSGLDNLITSGDAGARQSLIQGTQGQAQGLQDNVQGALKQYRDQRAAQEFAAKNIAGDVTGFGTEAVKQFSDLGSDITDIQARDATIQGMGYNEAEQASLDQELANRNQRRLELDNSTKNVESYIQQLRDNYGTKELRDEWQQNSPKDNLNYDASRDLWGHQGGMDWLNELERDQGVKTQDDARVSALEDANQANIANALRDRQAGARSEISTDVNKVRDDIARNNALQQLMGKNNQIDTTSLQEMLDRYNTQDVASAQDISTLPQTPLRGTR